jgi:hypothetical protein
MSVLKYILTITPPDGIAIDMLKKMLQAHAMDSIGTPIGIPPCLIMAETGN